VPLSICSAPSTSNSRNKSGQTKMQKYHNLKKPSTEQNTPKGSKGTRQKKNKQIAAPATQVVVSQHKAQERSGPPNQPEKDTSAASGNNIVFNRQF
jgi:hypothetical protein